VLSIAVDVGSNSILVTVAEKKQLNLNIIEDHSFVTGLGRQIQKNGVFLQEAMDDSLEVFAKIAELADKYKVLRKNVLVTATEASRLASNSKQYFASIKSLYDIETNIITAKAEAHFAGLGLTMSPFINNFPAIVLDIGGASTELIFINKLPFKVLETISMPIGSVVVTEDPSSLDKSLSNSNFTNFIQNKSSYDLWAISGSAIILAQKALNKKSYLDLEGETVQLEMLETFSNKIEKFEEHELNSQFGKRSKTIMGGMNILKKILNKMNISNFKVSNYGLRHGVLFQGEISNGFLWQRT
jgi:exopolyphosphatase/guanosine-5'-triphosphate,3'-diphosphate pyrophosphatase